MFNRTILVSLLACIAAGALALATPTSADGGRGAADRGNVSVERGKYLVSAMGCSDCHTPKNLGPNGPELDTTRLLSGHPESEKLPPAPVLPPGPWMVTTTGTLTAWNGPWGTSYPANLTPDPDTGLGKWTEDDFVNTIRSGRHLGRGRQILPPMPIDMIRNFTEEDLRSIFQYLHSLPPIKNRVPEPLPPPSAN
jgi:hypothetical protein